VDSVGTISLGTGHQRSLPKEEFEDTKGVIRICKLKKDRQHNGKKTGQKDKQRSTKHTHKLKIK